VDLAGDQGAADPRLQLVLQVALQGAGAVDRVEALRPGGTDGMLGGGHLWPELRAHRNIAVIVLHSRKMSAKMKIWQPILRRPCLPRPRALGQRGLPSHSLCPQRLRLARSLRCSRILRN
jgi:hypothetical protein